MQKPPGSSGGGASCYFGTAAHRGLKGYILENKRKVKEKEARQTAGGIARNRFGDDGAGQTASVYAPVSEAG